MIEKYNFTEIEKKWQKKWEEEKPFKVTEDTISGKNTMYWRCSRIRPESFIWDMSATIPSEMS